MASQLKIPGLRWLGRGADGAEVHQSLRTGRVYRFWPGPGGHLARPAGGGRFAFPGGLDAVVRHDSAATFVYHPSLPPRFGDQGALSSPSFEGGDYLALGVLGVVAAAAAVSKLVRSGSAKKGEAWIEREGKLGGPGYLTKSEAARRKILDECVSRWGYRSCLGSIMALERNRKIAKKYKRQLGADHRYLVSTHGGEGSLAVYEPERLHAQSKKRYPEARDAMVNVLAILRSLQWDIWTSHWTVAGPNSYGDHLLLQRLYSEGLPDQIDRLGERLVGYYGSPSVRSRDVMERSFEHVERWGRVECPVRRALVAEEDLQGAIRKAYDEGKRAGLLSLGLDDELMSLANAHDTNRYLLSQRLAEHTCSGCTKDR